MSRKTSPVADKDMGRTKHVNFLRDEALASSWLLAYGTSTLKVMINAGVSYFGGTKVEFAGGYSPEMTEPTNSSRIDVVSMQSSAEIVITVGVEADTPVAPTPPGDDIAICEVYHKAGEVKITDEDEEEGEGYINKDLREFLQQSPFLYVPPIAGELIILEALTQRETSSETYVKLKEIEITESGTYKVWFDLLKTAGGTLAYGRIYKNGVGFGTEQSTNQTEDQTYTEDLAFTKGDLLQLYAKQSGGAISYVNDLKLSVGQLKGGKIITN